MSSEETHADGSESVAIDFERRLRARSSTPESERKCCPSCGGLSINRRLARSPFDYRCEDCDETFDDPPTRSDWSTE